MKASLHLLAIVIALATLAAFAAPGSFQFVILGDRTGEAQPGVFEQVWSEAAAQNPAFLVSVGDSIQGDNDATAEAEWRAWEKIVAPYRRLPLYLTPGNHDIWSERSAQLYRRFAAHPLHYSFDFGAAHFTILDNSLSDELPAAEFTFLESDLEAHAAQPVKFVISHRPSWLLDVAFVNRQSRFHQLMRRYGVRNVIAGHVHQMLHVDFDGVTYISAPSSGGHLRNSKKYEDGWFFAYILVNVDKDETAFHIHELKPPHGQGRVTTPQDWGKAGQFLTPK
jgi:Calcineurin-like phosphoesterase